MTRIVSDRFFFRAIDKLTGESGQYNGSAQWVADKSYNASTGDHWQDAVSEWVLSLGPIDHIRFDGEGSGEFSSGVLRKIGWSNPKGAWASEFNPVLRESIARSGMIPYDHIMVDGIAQSVQGGEMVVIANQFIDALPFTVLRQDMKTGYYEELCIADDGHRYYSPFGWNTNIIDKSAILDNVRIGNPFVYSPSRANYLKTIFARRGITHLLVIDWSAEMTEDHFVRGIGEGGVLHAPVPTEWISSVASSFGATVSFAGWAVNWKYIYNRRSNIQMERYNALAITVVTVKNEGLRPGHETCNV
ncbi:hypothetical protein UFOVP1131_70 [uncultured Caudovirales phage]|uniref:Uncharacterized protein n=1 Tax=uncultured Caudovirales phage TaxID=2100421 RepID=A0A6J7XL94_9CAUD|nr:hypothetical protein UFOVP966_84 [uncultured Caudovirales phage]CAB4184956.1 hypothetical protein UFOVP1131_70 [uncultured Caudovirales phage]CAB4192891.1 hypothetical protein UFOVP1245_116 [uncultured Caudovirales phage]CAB5231317.1 hypothetical protein UFOVP1582_62 [uncultured Caudovirales phage]